MGTARPTLSAVISRAMRSARYSCWHVPSDRWPGSRVVFTASVTCKRPSAVRLTFVQRPSVISDSRRLAWRYTSGWLLLSQVAMALSSMRRASSRRA